MTTLELQERCRKISSRVYGVFMLSGVIALGACLLTTWLVSKGTESDVAAFGAALGVAVLVLGIPLGCALVWAGRAYEVLRDEVHEDAKAENFLLLQGFIHDYKKKETAHDEEQDEDFRSGDTEHA